DQQTPLGELAAGGDGLTILRAEVEAAGVQHPDAVAQAAPLQRMLEFAAQLGLALMAAPGLGGAFGADQDDLRPGRGFDSIRHELVRAALREGQSEVTSGADDGYARRRLTW